jgi:hypothetical protein
VASISELLRPLLILIASSTELEHPGIFPVCGACLCADADDFSSSEGKNVL